MKVRILSLMIASLALSGMALGDGLLGGGKGNGGGSNSGGGGGGKGSGGGSGPSKGSGGSGPSKGSGGSGPSKGSGGSGPSKGSGGNNPTPVPSTRGGGSPTNGSPRNGGIRNDRGNSTPLIQNQRTGRSGRNVVTSQSNNPRDSRTPIIVNSVPTRDTRRGNNGFGNGSSGNGNHNGQGSIAHQARNEDRSWTSYRNGYYQYNSTWQDCNFWYPYYSYTPTQFCIVGPFYWYSNLPGYLLLSRVFWTSDCISYNDWRDYRYRRDDRYDDYGYSSNRAVDDAIMDLEDAFLSRDYRSLDRLIPRGTSITITDRSYRNYRIRSEDFYDLMADLVSNTRTRDFNITRTQTRNGYLRINAQHSFEDAWRQNRTVYMTFILRQGYYGYEITEFETSGERY